MAEVFTLPPFFVMWNLTANTTNTVRATLKESVKDFASFTDYLVRLVNDYGDFTCIVSATTDTDRYSEFVLDLSQDDQVNGAVEITEVGEFEYYVYGQNSSTNLDHTDAVVVGVLEKGTAKITDSTTFYEDVSSTISKDIQL